MDEEIVVKQKQVKKKKMFLDIETDFKKHLLCVGIASSDNKVNEEYFIYQNEDNLFYPKEVDLKYLKVLEVWRGKGKTPLVDVLERVKSFEHTHIFTGWNIKGFDLPILRKYFEKCRMGDFFPEAIDGYFALRKYIKTHKRLDKALLNFNNGSNKGKLTAETVFKYVTKCSGYVEHHTALHDAEDERLMMKLLTQRYGKAFLAMG
jgi:hypothetical protein